MKKIFAPLIIFTALFITNAETIAQEFQVKLEGGGVWFTTNDVRIPNEGGTKFDMLDLIGTDINPYYRIYAYATLAERHTFRLLFAPLSVTGTGQLPMDTFFENATFSGNENIRGTYQFNNFRFTYRYTFLDNDSWTLGAGPAFLIRDAKVRLRQNNLDEENTDLGFVPLIHLYTKKKFNDRLSLILDGETLFGPQGRATDVWLGLSYNVSDSFTLQSGYRILEGGADVDQVFNFSWINYVTVSATFRF